MTIAEFFYMEGHGFYVWTSYALGLITFVALYVSTFSSKKRLEKQLQRQYRMQSHESGSALDDRENDN